MSMIALIGIVVITLLILGSSRNDPEAEQCAKEIISLLKSEPDASANAIAELLRKHNFGQRPSNPDQPSSDTHSAKARDAGKVTRIVKSKLHQVDSRKEAQQELMRRIRAAKQLL